MRSSRSAGPPPGPDALHQAALSHLARFATTAAGLRCVLDRRVQRWAQRASGEHAPEAIAAYCTTARQAVRTIVATLVASGAVDDAAFAAARARRLLRAGRSRAARSAHLAEKGVDAATREAALASDEEAELAAALVLARRRRIGPFRASPPHDPADPRRELGIFARAGYPQRIAARALAMDRAEAEERVLRLLRE